MIDPRSITDAERPHLERLADDHGSIAQFNFRLRLESEADATPTMAASVTTWLIDKLEGRPDHLSAPTKSRYRKLLKRLPATPGPGARRLVLLHAEPGESGAGELSEIPKRWATLETAVCAA